MSKKYDNSGTLGKNERKEKETHPSHTGRCTIDGKEYWISAWVRDGNNGRFFSLAFKPKEERKQESKPKASAPADSDDYGDDIPF